MKETRGAGSLTSIATAGIEDNLVIGEIQIQQRFQLLIRLVPIEGLRLLDVTIVPILFIMISQNLARFLFLPSLLPSSLLLRRHATHTTAAKYITTQMLIFLRKIHPRYSLSTIHIDNFATGLSQFAAKTESPRSQAEDSHDIAWLGLRHRNRNHTIPDNGLT